MSVTKTFWTPTSSIDYYTSGIGTLMFRMDKHPFGADEFHIEQPPGMRTADMLKVADSLLAGVQEWRDSIAAAAGKEAAR
nr:hypothetical protein KitaXyl93_20360 [Kitasatospora sp. Xyl93]